MLTPHVNQLSVHFILIRVSDGDRISPCEKRNLSVAIHDALYRHLEIDLQSLYAPVTRNRLTVQQSGGKWRAVGLCLGTKHLEQKSYLVAQEISSSRLIREFDEVPRAKEGPIAMA